MNLYTDVIVIGAGPAGIATAIAASQKGLQVVVLDARTPPIDKTCGEGLLPQGAAALHSLGIHLNSDVAVPLAGIRFAGRGSSAYGKFPGMTGFALRRIRLHQLLVERANQAGVIFHWGTHVTNIDSRQVAAGEMQIRYTWLVGADGQNSFVQKWANLSPLRTNDKRFGFRQHFRVHSWPNLVDVYWGDRCQILATPTGHHEVCIALLSSDATLRINQAFTLFPEFAAMLEGAVPITRETGSITCLNRLPAVTRGHIALVGDASGSVDAITGLGLSLAFQQAIFLAEAFESGDLAHYESAHRKIAAMPALMSRIMLIMDKNGWVRRRALRLFENNPNLFSKLLSIHTDSVPLSSIRVGEMIDFGWRLLRA